MGPNHPDRGDPIMATVGPGLGQPWVGGCMVLARGAVTGKTLVTNWRTRADAHDIAAALLTFPATKLRPLMVVRITRLKCRLARDHCAVVCKGCKL